MFIPKKGIIFPFTTVTTVPSHVCVCASDFNAFEVKLRDARHAHASNKLGPSGPRILSRKRNQGAACPGPNDLDRRSEARVAKSLQSIDA